ncbi:MAG TPA: aldehyde dehydrogenase family protein [Pseudolysinimonas sp.]|nr:aldehyde dehydrogenase family protein [Pseudolysinimonas sp.]
MSDYAKIYRPIDGSVLREVLRDTVDGVDVIVRRAKDAQAGWGERTPEERGLVLLRIADAIDRRRPELAEVEAANIGRSVAAADRTLDFVVKSFRFFGGFADKVYGQNIPLGPSLLTYTSREPHGVVAAIVPWNAPIFFAARKIAPAIAFGNSCVLKPAEETPLSSLLLLEIMLEAGLPEGVVQVLNGGRDVGEALVKHPQTDFVIFTGSDAGGRAVARTAADTLTPVALELGGKSPQIVFDDADLDAAVEPIAMGAYYEVGQACIAGSRLLVQEGVHDQLLERLKAFTESLLVGDPEKDGRRIGPQITRGQQQKTLQMVEDAERAGATRYAQAPMAAETQNSQGYWVTPTVFSGVSTDMEIWQEEVFGPVIATVPFSTEEDAIRLAHDTSFGLAAGVWTRDIGRGHRVASKLDVGMAWVNNYALVDDQVPFGGVRRSGYGSEGGWAAVDTYTRVKTVWTQIS